MQHSCWSLQAPEQLSIALHSKTGRRERSRVSDLWLLKDAALFLWREL